MINGVTMTVTKMGKTMTTEIQNKASAERDIGFLKLEKSYTQYTTPFWRRGLGTRLDIEVVYPVHNFVYARQHGSVNCQTRQTSKRCHVSGT